MQRFFVGIFAAATAAAVSALPNEAIPRGQDPDAGDSGEVWLFPGFGDLCGSTSDCATDGFMFCATSCTRSEGSELVCPSDTDLVPGTTGVCQPCQQCVFPENALSGSCRQCRTYFEGFGGYIEYLDNEGDHPEGTFWDTDEKPSGSGSAYVDCNVCAANILTSNTCGEFNVQEELLDQDPKYLLESTKIIGCSIICEDFVAQKCDAVLSPPATFAATTVRAATTFAATTVRAATTVAATTADATTTDATTADATTDAHTTVTIKRPQTTVPALPTGGVDSSGRVYTVLTASARSGASILQVESNDGFGIGDAIMIGGDSSTEMNTVRAFGSIILQSALTFDHTVGTRVTRLSGAVDTGGSKATTAFPTQVPGNEDTTVTDVPTTDAPTTDAPTTDAPTTDAPTTTTAFPTQFPGNEDTTVIEAPVTSTATIVQTTAAARAAPVDFSAESDGIAPESEEAVALADTFLASLGAVQDVTVSMVGFVIPDLSADDCDSVLTDDTREQFDSMWLVPVAGVAVFAPPVSISHYCSAYGSEGVIVQSEAVYAQMSLGSNMYEELVARSFSLAVPTSTGTLTLSVQPDFVQVNPASVTDLVTAIIDSGGLVNQLSPDVPDEPDREIVDGPPAPELEPEPIDEPLVGTSYCTFGPDTDCYANGWPACCSDDTVCPETAAECDREEDVVEAMAKEEGDADCSCDEEPTAGKGAKKKGGKKAGKHCKCGKGKSGKVKSSKKSKKGSDASSKSPGRHKKKGSGKKSKSPKSAKGGKMVRMWGTVKQGSRVHAATAGIMAAVIGAVLVAIYRKNPTRAVDLEGYGAAKSASPARRTAGEPNFDEYAPLVGPGSPRRGRTWASQAKGWAAAIASPASNV